ncbi:hypothetical protein GCM10010912_58410 [Paenibacillus albidus]|uniref:Uncharacterized protein n=1 Tax=Paenibacillus albidus TaxID=2041023 RepID=A0A917D0I7_9BACL|nr:hypothetical protein [Paenibacillus albidus]GGG06080.1 hypothetical protein GCM10010912_58410 [Paenibacillus albidus]
MLKEGVIVLLAGLATFGLAYESSDSVMNLKVIPDRVELMNQSTGAQLSPAEAEKVIASRAEQVIMALKESDMKKLGSLVHPVKGVRFSPDATIQAGGDLVFKGNELAALIQKDTVYEWGAYDGSGDPINLTFKQYLNSFVYDRDYANAEETAYNQFIAHSNSTNNLREVYPDAIFVEYHFKGPESSEISEFLFSSLRIIFESYQGEWYLVGTSHVHWTI